MKRYQVLALIGKAGAGKDTVQNVTCEAHPNIFHKIISHTTRPPRDNEVDGRDYHFTDIPDFTRRVLSCDMLEATEFRGWFYGTSLESLDENKVNIGVFNPAGVRAILESPDVDVKVIYVDTNDKTRLLRYLNRSENPDCAEMCRRYYADEQDFADLDFEYIKFYNHDGAKCDLTAYRYTAMIIDEMMRNIEALNR